VEELSDEVDLTLNDLKEGLVATKTLEAAMFKQMSKVRHFRMAFESFCCQGCWEHVVIEVQIVEGRV